MPTSGSVWEAGHVHQHTTRPKQGHLKNIPGSLGEGLTCKEDGHNALLVPRQCRRPKPFYWVQREKPACRAMSHCSARAVHHTRMIARILDEQTQEA
jgi:hypothetical protein